MDINLSLYKNNIAHTKTKNEECTSDLEEIATLKKLNGGHSKYIKTAVINFWPKWHIWPAELCHPTCGALHRSINMAAMKGLEC